MRKVQQLARRTFLMQVGRGSFALLAEATFGFGRRGLAIALGGSGLAAACTPIQAPTPSASSGAGVATGLEGVNYFQVVSEFVNSYVLVRGQEIAIVDTGLPNTGEKFAEVIRAAGLDWSAVNHLILTHYHGDHVGSMGEVLAAATQATVYAGAEDIPQIQTTQTIQAVGDGDEVFGLQIISTPGHTAGHICVLDPVSSLLVAGDAVVNQGGQLAVSPAQFTWDMDLAHESVRKLAGLQFKQAVFGHGDPIASGASVAMAELAETLGTP
jgi:glyoxylase-like metal-dependent hydrolase (beta-lactamase superfamily II)